MPKSRRANARRGTRRFPIPSWHSELRFEVNNQFKKHSQILKKHSQILKKHSDMLERILSILTCITNRLKIGDVPDTIPAVAVTVSDLGVHEDPLEIGTQTEEVYSLTGAHVRGPRTVCHVPLPSIAANLYQGEDNLPENYFKVIDDKGLILVKEVLNGLNHSKENLVNS